MFIFHLCVGKSTDSKNATRNVFGKFMNNLGVPATSGGRAIRGYALSRSIAPLRSATANAAATIPNAFLPKTFSANTKTFALD